MSKTRPYKYCLVPNCKSTTYTNPDKVFLFVPKVARGRQAWLRAMGRVEFMRGRQGRKNSKKLSHTSSHYCCEDHFELEHDMDNYMAWKMTGKKVRMRLKKGVVPHKFVCQNRKTSRPERQLSAGTCEVDGCKSKEGKTTGISFYKFPSEPAQVAVWLSVCGKPNLKPSRRSRICSTHFSEDQINRTLFPHTLRENAVPNIFTAAYFSNVRKAAAASSAEKDAEPTCLPDVVIKEEPIDIDEMQPSTSAEFILPSDIPLDDNGPTLTVGVAFSVADIKKEKPTSPISNGGKQVQKRQQKDDIAIEKRNRVDDEPNDEMNRVVDVTIEKRTRNFDMADEMSSDPVQDHFDAYGAYIAARLRKLDWKSCAYVQKAIGDIIFDAEMGKFKGET